MQYEYQVHLKLPSARTHGFYMNTAYMPTRPHEVLMLTRPWDVLIFGLLQNVMDAFGSWIRDVGDVNQPPSYKDWKREVEAGRIKPWAKDENYLPEEQLERARLGFDYKLREEALSLITLTVSWANRSRIRSSAPSRNSAR